MPIYKEPFFSQKNITLQDFFYETMRRWYLCLAIILVCVLASFGYAKLIVTPQYDSTARIYIVNKSSETINSSDFSISTYLANDFAEIIVDKVILNDVAAELNNEFTISELSQCLTVEIPQSTRIIQITARTDSPETSKKIVDSVCRISEQKLIEVMGLDRITTISEGSLSKYPSVPDTARIVLFGFIVSLILAFAVIYLFIITDNKISSSKDVEKYLGVNVLATIPYNPNKQKSKA